jgi:hypothetical protein
MTINKETKIRFLGYMFVKVITKVMDYLMNTEKLPKPA